MAWGEIANLKGPQGDPGDTGAPGAPGDQGPRGATWFTGADIPDVVPGAVAGDLYLRTTTGVVYLLS